MPDKYICIRQCFQRNPGGHWKLFNLGETEWWEHDPGKHWSKLPSGKTMTALDVMVEKCAEIGIKPEKEWDIGRLQREFDHKMAQIESEQNKQIMAKTTGEIDARSINPGEDHSKKRK
jgi:hypothetical protein